ncbi:hypothetical protein [Phytobacter sp. V91]
MQKKNEFEKQLGKTEQGPDVNTLAAIRKSTFTAKSKACCQKHPVSPEK